MTHHNSDRRTLDVTDRSLAIEQKHLDRIYGRLDTLRATAKRRRTENLQDITDTPQQLSERDSYNQMYSEDLAKYDAAEHNLCFGRLDMDSGEVRRIGRIGILADDDDLTTLLLDWRAPMSRPFYLATPAHAENVAIRRHIRTNNRAIVGVSDEALDPTLASNAVAKVSGDVANEGALVRALSAARTGSMNDIVETIQSEQDQIIRSDHRSVLVVQGGPGTGKTAVALHRVAYLLYTYRQTLSRSGVLIIGPNETFLNYIGDVLPSLGETGVLLSTIGDLYPGVRARIEDSPEAAAVKGSLTMVDVCKQAVRDRQVVPDEPIVVSFDGFPITITPKIVSRARGRARGSRRPHNAARPIFLQSAIDALAAQHADALGKNLVDNTSLLSRTDIADIRDEMRTNTVIAGVLDSLWPVLTPQDVLRDLWLDPGRLEAAATGLSHTERDALRQDKYRGFSSADAPLLDELAEFIGTSNDTDGDAAARTWREQIAEAQEALDILAGSAPQDLEDDLDPELLMAYDIIDAAQLAERQQVRNQLTTAERAKVDRTWAFGHVIVDEAQELSAMAWRMIMRRSPNRWMTVVGDTAQTGSPAGSTSWDEVMEPYTGQRWKLTTLTINYRTPSEIMDVAARVLASFAPYHAAPRSIRSSGYTPCAVSARYADQERMLAELASDHRRGELADGLLAIVVPDNRYLDLKHLSDSNVRVHTVTQAKGLEFDHVVVLEPQSIVEQSPRGMSDLYVGLTRATQCLTVIYDQTLPKELEVLRRS